MIFSPSRIIFMLGADCSEKLKWFHRRWSGALSTNSNLVTDNSVAKTQRSRRKVKHQRKIRRAREAEERQNNLFSFTKNGSIVRDWIKFRSFRFSLFSSGRSHFGTVKKRRPTAKKKKVFHFFRLSSPFEWPHTISSPRIWLRVVSPRKRSVDERNK